MKHIDHQGGETIDGIRPDASPEELRAEIAKRVVLLRDKGYLDLEALPPPANKEVAIADAEGDEQEESD